MCQFAVKVAVKKIRINIYGEATRILLEKKQRVSKETLGGNMLTTLR
jgi:hypothetical protein